MSACFSCVNVCFILSDNAFILHVKGGFECCNVCYASGYVAKTGHNVHILEVSVDRADVCVGMVGCDFTLSCFSRPRPSCDLPHFAFDKRASFSVERGGTTARQQENTTPNHTPTPNPKPNPNPNPTTPWKLCFQCRTVTPWQTLGQRSARCSKML